MPRGFINGIPHKNDNEKFQGQLWDAAQAFASTKVHCHGLLEQQFEGAGVGDRRFLCLVLPSLQPASGGGRRAEYVGRYHPMWEVLREMRDVGTHPDVLTRLFNTHDGEARLIEKGDWMPLEGGSFRHPQYWSSQFAKSGAPRR